MRCQLNWTDISVLMWIQGNWEKAGRDTNLSLHICGMSLSPCVTQGTWLWGKPKADPTKVSLSSSPSDRCKLACLLWRCRGGHECGESLLVHLAEKDHWDSFSSELWNIQPCLWQHVLQGVYPGQRSQPFSMTKWIHDRVNLKTCQIPQCMSAH